MQYRGFLHFLFLILSLIHILGHADGICHIYVAEDADIPMALKIIEDSKLQYPAACNAVETLLLHQDIYDKVISSITDKITLKEGEYNQEYLDTVMTVKKVSSIDEAIDSILSLIHIF